MSILKVIIYPNPILRKKCKSISKVTTEITKLINDMFETMYVAPGVGLAAPQVGKNIRLIVIDIGQGPIVLINPKIVKKSGQQTFTEGCLCLPGVEAPVDRASYVEVKGLDKAGKPVDYIAEGFLATVLQHEIDHLDGKVFIDRVKDTSLIKEVRFESEPKEERI
ncbi:MAG: peptide deformylase [Candidatus Margulisbacteria bacterium]|nr:peptide deformylase [Candidatus Margulisiibacteriota bacterium]MBU1021772.1 peptide deformylase [Candidatus Margulisiibacteriota bacterium]MBU1729518.1 peptide deformylase [Candidatus Margulisiibacteriota bacterium]MBU1955381.1 peptide deformylase [Candidatus Margulisiibacteriota bacterium]